MDCPPSSAHHQSGGNVWASSSHCTHCHGIHHTLIPPLLERKGPHHQYSHGPVCSFQGTFQQTQESRILYQNPCDLNYQFRGCPCWVCVFITQLNPQMPVGMAYVPLPPRSWVGQLPCSHQVRMQKFNLQVCFPLLSSLPQVLILITLIPVCVRTHPWIPSPPYPRKEPVLMSTQVLLSIPLLEIQVWLLGQHFVQVLGLIIYPQVDWFSGMTFCFVWMIQDCTSQRHQGIFPWTGLFLGSPVWMQIGFGVFQVWQG